ncbi:hypothetical protein DFH09DRAFT_1359811 [Mycena vulgaris]|nr:hypothetical protein DFH09DRAFT_1359811 [Mycena vulgaris]
MFSTKLFIILLAFGCALVAAAPAVNFLPLDEANPDKWKHQDGHVLANDVMRLPIIFSFFF